MKQSTRKDNKKKIIAILFCLPLAAALIVGSLFAFFSDIYTGTQDVAAGTLVLSGSAIFYINGSDQEADENDLKCLNPGDTIKAVISVENTGSKSAWLQGVFGLSAPGLTGTQFENAFTVYPGDTTSGTPLTVTAGSNSVSFTDNGTAILDGTYETETTTGAIQSTTTEMIYTIVFDSGANNDFQAAAISIEYAVKALQYRNNPAPDWDEAVELIKP